MRKKRSPQRMQRRRPTPVWVDRIRIRGFRVGVHGAQLSGERPRESGPGSVSSEVHDLPTKTFRTQGQFKESGATARRANGLTTKGIRPDHEGHPTTKGNRPDHEGHRIIRTEERFHRRVSRHGWISWLRPSRWRDRPSGSDGWQTRGRSRERVHRTRGAP